MTAAAAGAADAAPVARRQAAWVHSMRHAGIAAAAPVGVAVAPADAADVAAAAPDVACGSNHFHCHSACSALPPSARHRAALCGRETEREREVNPPAVGFQDVAYLSTTG